MMSNELLEELIAAVEKGNTHAWQNVNQITFYLKELIDARRKIDLLKEDAESLVENLLWCSGSADFAPGGKAEIGWEKSVRPALDNHIQVMEEFE